MANPSNRSDPIHDRYFAALHSAEFWGGIAFYASAVLSIAVLLVSEKKYPDAHQYLNVAFAVSVAVLFVIGVFTRIYWMSRAASARVRDFLGKAFDAPLTHLQTSGYYNNAQVTAVRRIAAMTMENAFFSKAITLKMAHWERTVGALYLVAYLVALANRKTDLGLIVGFTQIVFAEQVLVKWVRLEWLRQRCEETFSSLNQLFQAPPSSDLIFGAQAVAAFTDYESAKVNAGITLSNRIFTKENPTLSTEWEAIRKQLSI